MTSYDNMDEKIFQHPQINQCDTPHHQTEE